MVGAGHAGAQAGRWEPLSGTYELPLPPDERGQNEEGRGGAPWVTPGRPAQGAASAMPLTYLPPA